MHGAARRGMQKRSMESEDGGSRFVPPRPVEGETGGGDDARCPTTNRKLTSRAFPLLAAHCDPQCLGPASGRAGGRAAAGTRALQGSSGPLSPNFLVLLGTVGTHRKRSFPLARIARGTPCPRSTANWREANAADLFVRLPCTGTRVRMLPPCSCLFARVGCPTNKSRLLHRFTQRIEHSQHLSTSGTLSVTTNRHKLADGRTGRCVIVQARVSDMLRSELLGCLDDGRMLRSEVRVSPAEPKPGASESHCVGAMRMTISCVDKGGV